MFNTRMMYLRPGNLFKEFIIETNRQEVTNTGRVANSHTGNGTRTLKGCIAEASEEEKARHSRKDHDVTHTIVQAGRPKAGRTDRLILGERVFYVVAFDDASVLGISTVYFVEERRDVK